MNHKLAAALKAAGMSQSELARCIGIDASQVNRWVSGRLNPTYKQLMLTMYQLLEANPTMEIGSEETLGYRVISRPVVERIPA